MKVEDVRLHQKCVIVSEKKKSHCFKLGDIVEVVAPPDTDGFVNCCRIKKDMTICTQYIFCGDLEPIASKQVCKDKSPLHILIHREGLKTIVEIKQKGKSQPICRTEAKCDPNDEYNILTGAQIALQRAYEKIGQTLVMPIPRGCSAKLEPYFV